MVHWLRQRYNRRRLKDSQFSFLFETPPLEEWVCFDCETTSLDVKKAELLSIGAVIIQNNKILTSQKLELLIRPNNTIDEASIKVHHLRHCDLLDGLEPEQAIITFLHFIGYYLEFDVAMINKYLKPLLGIVLPNPQIEVSGIYYDKKQKTIPQGNIDLRFDTLLRELNLPLLGKHDAFNDALMTAMIYLKLKNIRRI